jgi:protein TonB
MPARLQIVRPSSSATVSGWTDPAAEPPAMPVSKTDEPVSEVVSEPVNPPEPLDSRELAAPSPETKPAEPIPATEAVETEAPPVVSATAPRRKLLWLAVAAALAASSGALLLYPGLFRRTPRPPAALTLRIERTATDLLLTWNRDSDAVRNARKAVLSISDGDHQENLDLNLSDLRNGSIVYSPLSSDVSFRMEVTGADQSKTASESVRVLRTKPSPMPPSDADAAGSKKKGGAPPSASEVPAASVAEEPAATDATAETPAPRRTPTGTFNVASLAQRLRPAQPTDLPEAPILGATPGSAGPVNLGSLVPPALTSAVPRPTAPPEAKTTPEPARDIRQPQLVTRVDPVYPALARRQRLTGTVSLSVTIGANGKINSVTPLSGPELLRLAAMDAVKQWVYSPMTLNGHPVQTEKQIDLNFTLGR